MPVFKPSRAPGLRIFFRSPLKLYSLWGIKNAQNIKVCVFRSLVKIKPVLKGLLAQYFLGKGHIHN